MQSFTEAEIVSAAQRANLAGDDIERLRAQLQLARGNAASFNAAHIAYYFGGLLLCGAMGWFVTDAWDRLSGLALFALAMLYGALFLSVSWYLARSSATFAPAGILATAAVCITPLAVFGLERQAGWWPAGDPGSYARFHPHIHGSWLLMEAATILSSALALCWLRFPFLTAPAAYALWYMSMDAPRLFGAQLSFHQEAWITVGFGTVLLVTGYIADGERDQDFAFWFYLFGLLAFSGGLAALGNGRQNGLLLFGSVHLVFIVVSLLLQRRVFLVFGAIGVFVFLTEEATRFFHGSFAFTLVLTAIGAGMIAAGVLFRRNETELTQMLEEFVPHRVSHRHGTSSRTV